MGSLMAQWPPRTIGTADVTWNPSGRKATKLAGGCGCRCDPWRDANNLRWWCTVAAICGMDWNHQWNNAPSVLLFMRPQSREIYDFFIPGLNEGCSGRPTIMCRGSLDKYSCLCVYKYVYIYTYILLFIDLFFVYKSLVWCLSIAILGQRHTWSDWKHWQESPLKALHCYTIVPDLERPFLKWTGNISSMGNIKPGLINP